MAEDEKELIKKIKNSFSVGLSRAEIIRRMQKKNYKLEYIDLLINKAKSRKLLILSFLLTLILVSGLFYLFIGFNEKENIKNPLTGFTAKISAKEPGFNNSTENLENIQITPAFLSYLLNEIGAYRLHKSFFSNEEAIISFNISGENYYSVVDGKIETLEGYREGDIEISTPSVEIINALLSKNPEEYFKQSVQNKTTNVKIIASESELLAKGYLGIYNSLNQ